MFRLQTGKLLCPQKENFGAETGVEKTLQMVQKTHDTQRS